MDLLISNNADVNIQTIENLETPLTYAIRRARKDLAERIISAGGDIHKINAENQSAIELSQTLAKEHESSDDDVLKRKYREIMHMIEDINNLQTILKNTNLEDKCFKIFVENELYEPKVIGDLSIKSLSEDPINLSEREAHKLINEVEAFRVRIEEEKKKRERKKKKKKKYKRNIKKKKERSKNIQ